MNSKQQAQKIFQIMFDNDHFSQWMKLECVEMQEGYCMLKMQIRKEMLNGFYLAHGGIAYSIADSALAFASNSHGRKCVSIETSISHTESIKEGDIITAEAKEISLTNKLAIYHVTITNQHKKNVAFFKGTVYRTTSEWFPDKI